MFKRGVTLTLLSVLSGLAPIAMAARPAGATMPGGNPGTLTWVAYYGGSDGLASKADNDTDPPAGDGQTITGGTAPVNPSWSPDGSRLAYAASDGNNEIYTTDENGGTVHKLTVTSGVNNLQPSWSPDGSKIVFISNRAGNYEIYTMNASDGSGLTRLTTNSATDNFPKFSPDGKKIAFTSTRTGGGDLYLMPAVGGTATKLYGTSAWEGMPDWDPSGKRLVFDKYIDSEDYLYFINPDGTHLTLVDLGLFYDDDYISLGYPVFSPDGTRLAFEFGCTFYCGLDEIVTVAVNGSDWTEAAYDDSEYDHFIMPTWRAGATPVNKVLPTVSGTASEGHTLKAAKGTWYGPTPTFSYQWMACDSNGANCANIVGQTGSSHVVDSTDIGKRLRVKVTDTAGLEVVTATSAATALVTTSAPFATVAPKNFRDCEARLHADHDNDWHVGWHGDGLVVEAPMDAVQQRGRVVRRYHWRNREHAQAGDLRHWAPHPLADHDAQWCRQHER